MKSKFDLGYNNKNSDSFSSITLGILSPEQILERSFGEVLKPETINYRSYKPEKDGLFCEKIFGPTKDWECHCGKYKRIRYRGIVCDRCGVEVTRKSVRRERIGHITLAVPVVHIWYLRSIPSKISYLLGYTTKQLEQIVYYEKFVVLNPGNSGREYGDMLEEEDYLNLVTEFGIDGVSEEERENDNYFMASMGGEAVLQLLRDLDVVGKINELLDLVKGKTSVQKREAALKRTARVGDGWLVSRASASDVGLGINKIKEYLKQYGRTGSIEEDHYGAILNFCFADSFNDAEILARPYLYPNSQDSDYRKFSILGRPENARNLIDSFIKAGATKFIARPCCPPEMMLEQLEILGQSVLPYYH